MSHTVAQKGLNMNFIGKEYRTVISIIVRVDKIVSEPIPEGDPEYLCHMSQEDLLYDTYVHCTGIQGTKDDNILVILTFSIGINPLELSEVKRVYKKGRFLKVQGEYYIKKPDDRLPLRIGIDNAIAFPLPKKVIRLHKDLIGEEYLQNSLDSSVNVIWE